MFPALDEYEVKMDGLHAKYHYWMPGEGVHPDLELQASRDISIDLEPGPYVFHTFVS